MITRDKNFQSFPLNLVGSSIFGRYPKIDSEHTFNMFISDNFLVPYAGYAIAVPSASFIPQSILGNKVGRGVFTSTKLNKLVVVIDNNVYLVDITYNQPPMQQFVYSVFFIGQLQTSVGVVYISENNKPQILISDGASLYLYDPTFSPTFRVVTIDFVPGYITFHDTYFIAAAKFDSAGNTNTWRLSAQNDGSVWPNASQNVGTLQTKPDNIQAVVRFPSRGNMIFVMGETVTESWFDTGAQLFPYQRQNQYNIDYGCLNPATVAYMDEIVVWLAANEKSGPIIMYSTGGMPEKITTDGIDYLFSQLQKPEDAQGFLYRQDGHLFYHINFYTDNLSFYYDFNTQKIYQAIDQDLNYFIAAQVAFINNQYYFITKNNGNLFAFDTIYTTFEDVTPNGTVEIHEIPRFRTCKNIRLPSQEFRILNDVGFTIETGETDYHQQVLPGEEVNLLAEDGTPLLTESGINIIVAINPIVINTTPRVDFSLSYDGGATFGNDFSYILNPIGQRRNRLMWWQCGIGNDFVCQFKFWGFGRFVVTDGIANVRM